ncbi:MAG: HAD family phosphatase [Solirubrobacteraceae bacterium MAG38_C4-C5]|nr:HAD family phosphatase [Candidatus Siliceabacter maunaloa]
MDTEAQWARAREALTARAGGAWRPGAHEAMMGMSSTEWTVYMHEQLAVPLSPPEILESIVDELGALFSVELPLLPGALQAVDAAATVGPLAVASSSPAALIDLVLDLAGVRERFATVLSSEDVPRGKPSPDVFVEACARLGITPPEAVAVEDSQAGLEAALAAGMRVVAVPSPHFPPADAVLARADVVLDTIEQVTATVLRGET